MVLFRTLYKVDGTLVQIVKGDHANKSSTILEEYLNYANNFSSIRNKMGFEITDFDILFLQTSFCVFTIAVV